MVVGDDATSAAMAASLFAKVMGGNCDHFKMLLFDKKTRFFFQEGSISDVLKCEICEAFGGFAP